MTQRLFLSHRRDTAFRRGWAGAGEGADLSALDGYLCGN